MKFENARSAIVVTAAAAFVASSLPTFAAMPMTNASTAKSDSLVVEIAKKKRTPRQSELDRSIDNRTVPSRYRSSVPKEYQQYIPFEQSKGR